MFSSLPPHFESEPCKKRNVMKTMCPLTVQCSNFPAKFCNCNVFPTGWSKTEVNRVFLRKHSCKSPCVETITEAMALANIKRYQLNSMVQPFSNLHASLGISCPCLPKKETGHLSSSTSRSNKPYVRLSSGA